MSATTSLDWRTRERRRTGPAFVASVLIHLLFIVLFALFLARSPLVRAPEAEPAPIQLTFVDAPKPKSEPAYVDTLPSQEVPKPPENAPFESDKNTVAAANAPATGNLPVPSQQGEESPALNFQNQESTLGPKPRPQPVTAPPVPPQETTPDQPAGTARPTPVPAAQVALLQPPKPKTQAKPPKEKSIPKPTAPPQPPGYQPQTRITRIRGNISNRGRSAVDAAATPLGRYKKMLADAIGSRWYYYVHEQISLLNVGTLEVQFVVRQSGKVERIRVVSNSSNESFASTSIRAIMEAEIPEIPPDLVPMLQDGRIEIEYTFTIMGN